MVATSDGFEIAEKDLELRGPGEFFGTRQAGMPSLRVANLIRDRKLLELAKARGARIAGRKRRSGRAGGEANGRAVSEDALEPALWAGGGGIRRGTFIAGAERGVSCTLDDMIVGIGVDLCEVERMEAAIARHGERFLARIYTEAERAYCESKPNRMERFAGRFAAKEAAMKAIGTGWSRGVGWRDFEVTRACQRAAGHLLPRRGAQNCRRAWRDAGAGFHHPHQEHGAWRKWCWRRSEEQCPRLSG